MKRWFLLVLASLFCLQASWAAAAAYCKHDADAVTGHFGHHEHKHVASSPDSSGLGGLDNDCGICHLTCCQVTPGDSAPLHWSAPSPVVEPLQHQHPSIIPQGPERPNWSASAWFRRNAPSSI
jgi:hypothetical protein